MGDLQIGYRMTTPEARGRARGHLRMAREYGDVAVLAADSGRQSPSISNAVLAAINAKDAICLWLTGKTGKSDDHAAAARELRAALAARVDGEPQALIDLIKQKNRVQYDAGFASAKESKAALRRADALLACAMQVMAGGS